MRIKQTIFLVLITVLAVGIGLFGFWFGPEIGKYTKDIPEPVLAETTNQDYHNIITTAFAPVETYKAFFASPQTVVAPTSSITSLVLPHHLITGSYISGVFESVKNLQPSVVVIIGPNHSGAGNNFILSSESDWDTGVGILSPDIKLINSLLSSNLVGIDDTVLANENSVGALLPFIKNTWPNTKVVPLAIKNISNDESVSGLAAKLYEILPSNSLVIASVDFSHYLSKNVANFHDELAMNILATGDAKRIKKMEIDSQNSICALLRYNDIAGAKKFTLAYHTNSADILKQNDLTETTSHVMGYFSKDNAGAEPEISLQLFGDMMLERSVEKNFGENGLDYVFDNLKGLENRFFYGADLFVANLEGPFAPTRVPTTKSIAFRFDPRLGADLKHYNFAGFSLANNHGLDMGVKNYDFTKQVLSDNGLAYFGNQIKEGSVYTWVAGEKEGLPEPVAFIGVNNTDHLLNMANVKEAINAAKKEARYVIVYAHWGNEYERLASPSQKELGHWFIDNDVTAVIGMHPHVVQEMEIYNNHPIFYSLGNFVFDQYFSKDTQEGISVGLNLQSDQVKNIYVFPFYSVKSQNSLMSGERQVGFFNWWNKNSRLGEKVFENNKLELN